MLTDFRILFIFNSKKCRTEETFVEILSNIIFNYFTKQITFVCYTNAILKYILIRDILN